MVTKAPTETFGQQLRRLRLAAGMTQRDIAQQLHLSHNAVHLWETDQRIPIYSLSLQLTSIFKDLSDARQAP
jgi:transcriptional regulator with XRE-family HTH domain